MSDFSARPSSTTRAITDSGPSAPEVELIANIGYETAGLRSKSWDEFSGDDAPVMDFVFTDKLSLRRKLAEIGETKDDDSA